MHVTVVYESLFGNTRRIAESIAAGAADAGTTVEVLPTTEATSDRLATADLLIVGGPTHALRMSTAASRQQGTRQTGTEAGADGPGVREWLAGLPAARDGCSAAAFDTRFGFVVAGSAARSIARGLRRHGYRVVTHPRGFIVSGSRGPLRSGESEKAHDWGEELVRLS